jgi:hypothetical protein
MGANGREMTTAIHHTTANSFHFHRCILKKVLMAIALKALAAIALHFLNKHVKCNILHKGELRSG